MKLDVFDKLFWTGLIGLYCVFALPLLSIGTDEIRMVGVFSIDESDILMQVHRLYEGGIYQVPSFTYGGGIYYAVLSLVYLWDIFGIVDEQVIALALRAFCLVAGIANLVLVAHLGNLTFDRQTGRIAAFLLVTMPVFLRWTVEGHPDLPQLFWIMCTLIMCVHLSRNFTIHHTMFAAGFAGLAFGTKYGGVFLLPVIGLSVFFTAEDGIFRVQHILANFKILRRWLVLLCVPLVFGFAYAVTNPYAIIHFDLLVQKIQSYRSVMSAGHTYVGESSGYLWLTMMGASIGILHGGMFLVGCLSLRRVVRVERLVLLIWCVVLLGYLMVNVQMRHMRHLLPILPCVLLFVSAGYLHLSKYASGRLRKPVWVFLVLLAVLGVAGRVQSSVILFEHKWTATSNREDIEAGRWLQENYSAETTILYDAYAYIPGKFQKALPATPAMTYPVVTHFEPDLLVVRDARHHRYSNLADSSAVSINKNDFFDIHYFYPYLEKGLLGDYKLQKAFGRTMIYERVLPRNHSFTFASCHEMLQNGQMLNVVSARERMGDAAVQVGDWQEAVRLYRLGGDAFPDEVMLQYKLGRAYALVGQVAESERIFEWVLNKRKDVGQQEKADILWDIAQFYFAGGQYELALNYLKESIALDGDRPQAHFDVATCQLALGRTREAVELFEAAKKQFNPNDATRAKLNALYERGVYQEIVENVLTQLF